MSIIIVIGEIDIDYYDCCYNSKIDPNLQDHNSNFELARSEPTYQTYDDQFLVIQNQHPTFIHDDPYNQSASNNLESFLFQSYPNQPDYQSASNPYLPNRNQPQAESNAVDDLFYYLPEITKFSESNNNLVEHSKSPMEESIYLQAYHNQRRPTIGSGSLEKVGRYRGINDNASSVGREIPENVGPQSTQIIRPNRHRELNPMSKTNSVHYNNNNQQAPKSKKRARVMVGPTIDTGIIAHPFQNTQTSLPLEFAQTPRVMPYKKQQPSRKAITMKLNQYQEEPGTMVLKEKKIEDGRKVELHQKSPMTPMDVNNLLAKLQSMSSNNSNDMRSSIRDDDFIEHDSIIDKEDLDEMKKLHKIDRLIPTSHLFGGSIGIVNDAKIGGDRVNSLNGQFENIGTSNITASASEAKDEAIVKNLMDIASMFASTNNSGTAANSPHVEPIRNFHNPQVSSRIKNRVGTQTDTKPSIPIDFLVDQLLSKSRLASFGHQHSPASETSDNNSLLSPIATEELESSGDGDDDDDDEDDEDPSGNDTDNSSSGSSISNIEQSSPNGMDVEESSLSELMVALPNDLNFSSVTKLDNPWLPVTRIESQADNITDVDDKIGQNNLNNSSKKRRDKRNDGETYWMIGDKLVSRSELVRMIGLLNSSASSKIASKERDSSRKLLKFLVSLALEDYRQRQAQGDRKKSTPAADKTGNALIRELIGTILAEPKEDDHMSTMKNRPLHVSHETPSTLVQKTLVGDPNQAQQSEEKEPKKSFNELANDLEQYFDSEFYEDLADKKPQQLSDSVVQNGHSDKEPRRSGSSTKRRKSRSGSPLPVPVYGQKDLDDADEDDVELDHVRVVADRDGPKSTKFKRRNQRNRAKKRQQPTRSKAKKRRRLEIEVADDDTESEDDSRNYDYADDSDNEDRPRRARLSNNVDNDARIRSESRRRKVTRPRASSRDDAIQEDQEPPEIAAQDSNEERGDGYNDYTANEPDDSRVADVEEDVEHRVRDSRVAKRKNWAKKSGPAKGSRHRRKDKRIRRNHQRGGDKRKRPKLEYDTKRDEIPAPIEAAKPTANKLGTSVKTVKSATTSRQAQGKPGLAVKKSGQAKRDDKAHRAESSNKVKQSKKRIPIGDEKNKSLNASRVSKKVETQTDPDNYNEGTSYSQVCDDKGPCKVVVKSSSPKLSRAIKGRDQKAIVKQLDNWIDEPE